MSAPLSCPFCNAQVPAGAGLAAGDKVVCPRCEESFALRRPTDAVQPAPGPVSAFTLGPARSAAPVEALEGDSFAGKVKLWLDVFFALAILLTVGTLVLTGSGVLVFSLGLVVGAALWWAFFSLPPSHPFVPVLPVLLVLGVAGLWAWRLLGGGPTVEALAGIGLVYGVVGAASFLWLWFFRVSRSNGVTAGFVLANMGLLASTSLALALSTQDFRRLNDRGLIKARLRPTRPAEPPAPPGPSGPASDPLEALGYLPRNTNVLLVVRTADLATAPGGQEALEAVGIGGSSIRLDRIRGLTGLDASAVDLLAVGLRIDEIIPPPITMVVRTKAPYDQARVRQALNASEVARAGGDRPLYRIQASGLPELARGGRLWFADDHTFVLRFLSLTMQEKSPDPGVPLTPRRGPDEVPEDLRQLVKEKVETAAPLWLAVAVADWKALEPAADFGLFPRNQVERLRLIRRAAGWARPGGQASAALAFEGVDAAAAERLEKELLGPRKHVKGLTAKREGAWLTIRWKGKPGELKEALRGR
jgi:hypothetical protein